MRYEGTIYRPPSEANSLLIQATIGCPHNKCTFCDMYKGTRFRLRPVNEIMADIKMAREHYGPWVKSMFLPDGNTIIMKTDDLVQILEFASSMFPAMDRITVYGSARYVDKKSVDDLKRLHEAGLNRIHMGMETGDDVTLERVCKGSTAERIISAGRKVKEAGIQLSEYYLVGIGGQERTREHALESARVLSAVRPDFLRIRTFVPLPGTPIYPDYENGTFKLVSPHQALREIRLLIENLDSPGTWVVSDHVSNYWNVQGQLPQDKEAMLAEIDYALSIPEERFRHADVDYL